MTRKGSEKICRLAFEIARAEGRKKVTCATKANILKFTEGLFKRVFEEVAKDYPEISSDEIYESVELPPRSLCARVRG